MDLTTRHIGGVAHGASKIIELTVDICGAKITEDVTNTSGEVDEDLISQLREIADELEEQNNRIKTKTE